MWLPSRRSPPRHSSETYPALDFLPISPHSAAHPAPFLPRLYFPSVSISSRAHTSIAASTSHRSFLSLPAAGRSRSFQTVRKRIRRFAVEFERHTLGDSKQEIKDGGCRVMPRMRSAENGNNTERENNRGTQTPRQH